MDLQALGAEFRRNGCVKIPGFLDPEALAHCKRCFDEALNTPEKKLPHTAYADGTVYNPASGYRGPNASFKVLLEAHPKIVQMVASLFGTSANVWYYDHEIFNKAIGGDVWGGLQRNADHTETPFHQDTRVVAFAGEHLANVWIPLHPADLRKENALHMVRGSHRGKLYNFGGYNFNAGHEPNRPSTTRMPWIPEHFAPEEICSWDLSAGDVIVLHSGTIHGGGPVDEDCPTRDALVLRLFGDSAFYTTDVGQFSIGRFYKGVKHGEHFSKCNQGDMMHLMGPGLPDAAGPPAGGNLLDAEGYPWWVAQAKL